jgi:hypothetical protein
MLDPRLASYPLICREDDAEEDGIKIKKKIIIFILENGVFLGWKSEQR